MLAEGLWGDGDILFYQPSAQREERRTEENEATVHVKAKKKKNMLQENIRNQTVGEESLEERRSCDSFHF